MTDDATNEHEKLPADEVVASADAHAVDDVEDDGTPAEVADPFAGDENAKPIETAADAGQALIATLPADATVAHDQRAEAMRDVLSGKDPVFVQVGSAAQIESAVAWFKARGMRCAVIGGEGVETAIPFLKANAVPVVLNGVHRVPGNRHARSDEAYTLPRKLAEAGIDFSIATGDEPAHTRNLPHHAATAAAFGLDREAALRAVTSSPCRIAGISNRYGTIEPLKSATLILTDGHPLELTSAVAAAWIDGETIDLSSHQSAMKRKYDEKIDRSGK